MVPITCHCTLKKLAKKGQFVCNLVKKKLRAGPCFFFQEGGAISKGGHVSSFERGGPLAWEVHWHGAMRQRKLGSHTPPCHRRMVITTLFSVLLAALQRRPVLYHTRWLLTVHRHWSSGHSGQLAPTTHPQCRLVSNPCPAGRDPVMHLHSGS